MLPLLKGVKMEAHLSGKKPDAMKRGGSAFETTAH